MTIAKELRELAELLESLTRLHPCNSMAMPYVKIATDALTMRARIIDLERQVDAVKENSTSPTLPDMD